MNVVTFEEAIFRIEELEKEVSELKLENEKLRNRNIGGRKKHDEVWMSSYNNFVGKYESGMTLIEIVAEGDISRRTAYRYLAYYKKMHKTEDVDRIR